MRINKYIASSGVCSRRKAEELVLAGDVVVNGEVITSLSFDVGEQDRVFVKNVEIKIMDKKEYIMLHKPKGYICACRDDKGRRTVMDLLPEPLKHLKPVGRLDYDSEGLLFYGNVILPFEDHFPADLELYRIMTTKFSETQEPKEV